jgi:UPF0271 protein
MTSSIKTPKIPHSYTYVLDATAFYAGIPYASTGAYKTTPEVIREVLHGKMMSIAIQVLLQSKRLEVTQPTEVSLQRVKKLASETGDLASLSTADITVLALALDSSIKSDVCISTGDYTIQNLANHLGIKISPTNREIKKTVKWLRYCPGCGRQYHNPNVKICSTCGTTLKRKFAKSV